MRYFYNDEYTVNGEVWTLEEFKDLLEEEMWNLKEIELLEMKRNYGGQMWCYAGERFVEKGDCGKHCINYKPCNGKSGRCRYLENGFIGTGDTYILTKNGLKEATND
jgi:hypothetical protein